MSLNYSTFITLMTSVLMVTFDPLLEIIILFMLVVRLLHCIFFFNIMSLLMKANKYIGFVFFTSASLPKHDMLSWKIRT